MKFVPVAEPKAATWTVAVGATGSYEIYAKWPASSTHATDVPYGVTHAGGTSTVVVNQRVNGGQWNLLGTYSFDTGTSYKVEVSDAVTAGKVAADAIYIAPAGAPPTDAFTWTPTIPSAGIYQVYARWPASSANTGAAQYTVTHGGGTANVALNQKQNGGSWVPLGSWSFAPGSGHKVTLAAAADGTTIADAMLFAAAGTQPANLLYVHPDHLGSSQKMTDASQAVVWDGVFDPFGEEVAIAGLAAMQMRFPGQYADPESGFSYNYFRDYEPNLGRYLQSDPIGLAGGLNTFAYVGSNPVGYADPTGECPWCIAVLVGAGTGALTDFAIQMISNGGRWECIDWWDVAISGAIGATGSGIGGLSMIRRAGTEWSHWIPDRYINPLRRDYKPWLDNRLARWFINNRGLNGNYVTERFHHLTDFWSRAPGMRNADKYRRAIQQVLRVPLWLYGTLAGNIGGAIHSSPSSTCECGDRR